MSVWKNNIIAFWKKKCHYCNVNAEQLGEIITKLQELQAEAFMGDGGKVKLIIMENTRRGDNEKAPTYFLNAVYDDGSETVYNDKPEILIDKELPEVEESKSPEDDEELPWE